MRTVVVPTLSEAEYPWRRRNYAVAPPDDARVVDGDVRVVDDAGALVAVGLRVPDDLRPTLRTLRARLAAVGFWYGDAPTGNENRLSGIVSRHQVFGYSAPVPLRRRYGCASCHFNLEHPEVVSVLADLSLPLFRTFAAVAPDLADAHDRLVRSSILPDWLWGGSPWTSGIINKTAALPYHVDAGNLLGSWSAMLTLRREVGGGLLHLPAHDLYVACSDATVLFFNGAEVLHGVTPLAIPPRGGAQRYTIVWYAKAAMRDCVESDRELARAQARRTAAEDRIVEEVRALRRARAAGIGEGLA